MRLWETDNEKSALLSLLYGIDETLNKDEVKQRLSELKEEKTSIIQNMIIPNILENYDTSLDKCNVIEIGSGAGIMVDWLAPQVNSLSCIDVSETILDACKEQNKQHKNVSYHLIENNIDFSEIKNIDFVYSQSVFIHLSILDFYVYLNELYKSLNKGGLIYIDIIDSDVDEFTLQEEEFQRQLKALTLGYKRGINTLYHVNSSSTLTKTANELGYELVWSQGSIYNPANVSLIYKKV
tara:strand:- start:261 stop:974 length:714 start_codon:yes stop_codon:yes gene_type:complete